MDGCNKTVTRVKPCFQALQLFARLAFVMVCFRLTVSTMQSPEVKYAGHASPLRVSSTYRSEVYSCKLQETHTIRYSNRWWFCMCFLAQKEPQAEKDSHHLQCILYNSVQKSRPDYSPWSSPQSRVQVLQIHTCLIHNSCVVRVCTFCVHIYNSVAWSSVTFW